MNNSERFIESEKVCVTGAWRKQGRGWGMRVEREWARELGKEWGVLLMALGSSWRILSSKANIDL